MRVATANIRHGRPDGAAGPDPARLADTLGRIGADVLAVQEVDRRTRRAGGADQVTARASTTSTVDQTSRAIAKTIPGLAGAGGAYVVIVMRAS